MGLYPPTVNLLEREYLMGNYVPPSNETSTYLLEDMNTTGPSSNVVPLNRDPLAGYNRRDRRRLLARARRHLRRDDR